MFDDKILKLCVLICYFVFFFGDTSSAYVGSPFSVFYNFSLILMNSLFPFHFISVHFPHFYPLCPALSFSSCISDLAPGLRSAILCRLHFPLNFTPEHYAHFIPSCCLTYSYLDFGIPTWKYYFMDKVLHWDLIFLKVHGKIFIYNVHLFSGNIFIEYSSVHTFCPFVIFF